MQCAIEIDALPEVVYDVMFSELTLPMWLSSGAFLYPNATANYFLDWPNGYHTSGQITAREHGKRLAMTWRGSTETEFSQVEMVLSAAGDGHTRVDVSHLGGDDAEHQKGWETALQNLKYTVETGLNLRLMNSPMLGIYPSALTAERAQSLGTPVTEGVVIENVLAGMGAASAGLTSGDVLVSLGGAAIADFGSMFAALRPHKGGDTVEIAFYRGAERHSARLLLSKRSMPELPVNVEGLKITAENLHNDVDDRLDALLSGLSESAAAQRPAPEVWSISENLAHLIWTERFLHVLLWGMAEGIDSAQWAVNNTVQLAGILAAYPTLADLVTEFKRSEAATRAMIAALPETITENRPRFVRIAADVTEYVDHTREHLDQIQQALDALAQA